MRVLRLAVLFAAAAATAAPVPAALPPQHQRAAELRAVLDHPGVVGAFGSTPIERIEYLRTDLYRVTAGRCRVNVTIVDLPTPSGVVGGRRFEARPAAPVCAQSGGRR